MLCDAFVFFCSFFGAAGSFCLIFFLMGWLRIARRFGMYGSEEQQTDLSSGVL
jgi:hypothetical protein